MAYFYNTPDDQRAMLDSIGAKEIDELFQSIPDELRLDQPLDIDAALSEIELTQHMSGVASRNQPSSESVCFLGGGSYDHFVPAAVDTIASRGEFYTSYTPYQAEVSQGNLQAIFEYQSLIAQLTGLDISNASVYDGGSATAEAVLMAMTCSGRHGKVAVAASLHPEYRQTIATYLANLETELITVPAADGALAPDDLSAAIDEETACVVIQHPNFFGALEEMTPIRKVTHDAGALLVCVFDPISLGMLARPGDYDADIAVAEGQSLGTAMSYGGPYLGIMACKQKYVRRMPGRIAGQTVDRHGDRCFVLTLQTREQHIRREKATSNICTNQGLFALRAAVYLSLMGPRGLKEVAGLCLQKSRYAAEQITASDRFSLAFSRPTFKEFVVRDHEARVDELLRTARDAGFFAGIPLGRWYPELDDCFLVCVTEKRTKQEIDALTKVLHNSTSPAAIHA